MDCHKSTKSEIYWILLGFFISPHYNIIEQLKLNAYMTHTEIQ
jgi:hypothetical protein